MCKMTDNVYWIWLSLTCGLNCDVGVPLLSAFGSPKSIYEADAKAFSELNWLKPELIRSLSDKSLEHAKRLEEFCIRNTIGLLTYDNPCYPERLRRIRRAPILLYYKGKLPNIDTSLCLALVGTRSMSDYGGRMAYRIGYELAVSGAVVVSGMALGIDGMGHQGALDARGHTIAVLGCGIDRVYPPEHKKLMQEISEYGTVLTEFSPHAEPKGTHFPIRNRIISGLCQGTVIVEAAEKSGALITAAEALQQGRDVFALPGEIDNPSFSGNNALIKEGAKLIESAEDILRDYKFLYSDTVHPERLNDSEYFAYFQDKIKYRREPHAKRTRRSSAVDSVPPFIPFPDTEELVPVKKKSAGGEAAEPEYRRGEPKAEKQKEAFKTLPVGLSAEEMTIYAALGKPKTVDELTATEIPVDKILTILTILELGGHIRALPGGFYERKKN